MLFKRNVLFCCSCLILVFRTANGSQSVDDVTRSSCQIVHLTPTPATKAVSSAIVTTTSASVIELPRDIWDNIGVH